MNNLNDNSFMAKELLYRQLQNQKIDAEKLAQLILQDANSYVLKILHEQQAKINAIES